MSDAAAIIGELRRIADPEKVDGMNRFGINGTGMLGVPMPKLRALAKLAGRNHALAAELWRSGIHEARILATLTEEPGRVTEKQMEAWASKFNSWDLCDQCCLNLFDKTPYARTKAVEWSERKEEFVRRAGFALMAVIAVHDREAPDSLFAGFLACIERAADDERNFVRKAVNWALRQIGKRSETLHAPAVAAARRLMKRSSSSARWIGTDALRELTDERTLSRLRRKSSPGGNRKHGKR